MAMPRKPDASPKSVARRVQPRYTQDEWDLLPVTLTCFEVARAIGTNVRWPSDHAEEIGGKKIAGRWVFSKRVIAHYLGIKD